MQIEIVQKTAKNPHKARNGDYAAAKLFAEEELVVLAISDGVGSSPCDWKASQISCQRFMEEFERLSGKAMEERLENSIQAANTSVLLTAGACEGMKATFCALVWDFRAQQIYYTNIGDSRIYLKVEDRLQQISTDEVASVILRKKDGKPIILSGVAVVAEGVTNVMGSKELTFAIKTRPAQGLSALVLTTDGFHQVSPNFAEDTVKAINALNLESSVAHLLQKYQDEQKDDMTILVLRKGAQADNQEAVVAAVLKGETLSGFSELEIAEATWQGIAQGIRTHDAKQVASLLRLSDQKGIDFGKQKVGDLISLMSKSNFQSRAIYQQLLRKLRASS